MSLMMFGAPWARRNTARSAAQRNSGNRFVKSEPPQGATESVASEISFLKGQSMRAQNYFELIEKRNRSMMICLSLDVMTNLGDLRLTHRERTVTFLPRESRCVRKRSRNPSRRIRLELANELRDRLVLPQFRQDVDVIRGPVDNQGDSFFIANSATKVLMNARTNGRRQPWFTTLRRKDNVIEKVAIGGTHNWGAFRRPLSGAIPAFNYIPGVPLRSTPGFNTPHPSGAVAASDRLKKLPK